MRCLFLLLVVALPALAEDGGIVSGRVIDEDGNPIAGAYVGSANYAKAETDVDGRFSFRERSGTHGTYSVGHIEFLGTEFSCPIPSSGNRVVMKRGLAITGRVAFPDGKPMVGACVRAWVDRIPSYGVLPPRMRVRTRADGSFRFPGLRAGEKFELDCLGARAMAQAGDDGVDLRLRESVIRFSVRDEHGCPVSPRRLSTNCCRGDEPVHRGSVRRIDYGEYLIPAREADRVLVCPVVDDCEMPVADIRVRGSPRLIRAGVTVRPLARPARLTLEVRDERGKSPDRVRVTLTNAAGASPPGIWLRRVELTKGVAAIRGIPSGAYYLSVLPENGDQGFHLGTGTDVTLGRGQALTTPVVLPIGGRLCITVNGDAPLLGLEDGCELEIRGPDGSWLPWQSVYCPPGIWSALDGPIRPGRYAVRVKRRDIVVVETTATILAGRLTSLRITVPD